MNVARAALESDGFGLAGNVPSDALLAVDLVAELVEVDDLELGAEFDGTLLWLETAKQELEQGGLTASVGPDDADLVPAPERGGKVADDRRSAVAEGGILCLDDFLAGGASLLQFDLCGAGALASLAPLGAKGFQCANAPLVAGATGFYSLTEPYLLLGELLVKGGPLLLLCLKGCTFPFEIGVVVAGPAGEMATVQLHDAGGEFPQEGPVVRHEEEGRPGFE